MAWFKQVNFNEEDRLYIRWTDTIYNNTYFYHSAYSPINKFRVTFSDQQQFMKLIHSYE